MDGDLDFIKQKIHSFQGKIDLDIYLEWEKKVSWIFYCHNLFRAEKCEIYSD